MSPNTESIWVFGYGSLMWDPGFDFLNKSQGVVKGYARRFWQGNATHRGTPSQPGRVATLIEDTNSEVWGVAYELGGDEAIAYLNNREVTLGGYVTKFSKFYPHQGGGPISVLIYIATSDSVYWQGQASENDIAEQIISCYGSSGYNVEYVIRLAEFMKDHAPNVSDPHLFCLEDLVRRKVAERELNLELLMGAPVPEAPTEDDVGPLPAPTSRALSNRRNAAASACDSRPMDTAHQTCSFSVRLRMCR